MKLNYIVFALCSFFLTTASAQTLEQAKSMFTRGEYDKAKPVFERLAKSAPNNANYNYWYGVCCLKTGEIQQSIKYLEFAHKKKIQNAPLHLGQAYDELYQFDEAVRAYEDYIDILSKKKQSAEETTALLEKSKINARMLKGVEEVCVIDSFVVDKTSFLKAYKLSEESGKIYTYNEFFRDHRAHKGTVYETELGNKVYYSQLGEDGTQNIYSKSKLLDEWSAGTPLPGSINASANTNYPFVLTDGITIYYAADGETSMGGYDIFVTRYNTGTDSYLSPENVGMPFNSPFNDYMYAIDEYNDLGWFVTDRNQPEEKVCIYVFVPNSSKQTYNYEAMEPERIRNLARLNSIQDTWKNESVVRAAKERLESAMNQKPREQKQYDFTFIINDNLNYHSIDDFKSPGAKEQFKKYQQMERDYRQQADKLESQRTQYAKAGKDEKVKTAPAIMDLEKRVMQMYQELKQLEVNIRNQEHTNIKR